MLQGGLPSLSYVSSGGKEPVIVTFAGCSAEYALNSCVFVLPDGVLLLLVGFCARLRE